MAKWYQRAWRGTRRAAERAGTTVKETAYDAVELAAPIAGAAIGAAVCGGLTAGLAGPACAAAGGAAGAYLAERGRRGLAAAGEAATGWLDHRGDGPPPPRPENVPAVLEGAYVPYGRVVGRYEGAEPAWAQAMRVGVVALVVAGTAAAAYYLAQRQAEA